MSALAVIALAALPTFAAEGATGAAHRVSAAVLESEAMNRMLRADRDKDGVLSRQELEQYDAALARRFNEADADRDGKLTLYEFEKLLVPEEQTASRK